MNTNKITAVLFDMDGVLYDSMPAHAEAWVGAFKSYGIKVPAKAVYEAEGMPDPACARFLAKLTKSKFPKSTIETIVERKKELFNRLPQAKQIKGAKPLIKYLKRRQYKVAIVTGSGQKKTLDRLKKDFGVERGSIVGGKDVAKGKPHPSPFLEALKKLKTPAEAALVVENAPMGIKAAKAAKIQSVALNTGPLSKAQLTREGAQLVLKDCAELLKLFKSQKKKK